MGLVIAQVNILQQLEKRLGKCRQKKDESVFQECPHCGNTKWNFEVNISKNVYSCWVCGAAGTIRGLFYDLGVNVILPYIPHVKKEETEKEKKVSIFSEGVAPLTTDNESAMAYLASRNITQEDVCRYRLQWWPDQQRIIFPIYDISGNLLFWTARYIGKDRWQRKYIHSEVEKSELVLALYGDSIESMYLVEGIFDALRLHKEGKSVIVLMGTSISNAVVSFLRELKCKACLVLDADAADRQRKHENVLVKYLGRDKVEAIYLRNGDVSSDGLHGSSGLLGYIQNKMR